MPRELAKATETQKHLRTEMFDLADKMAQNMSDIVVLLENPGLAEYDAAKTRLSLLNDRIGSLLEMRSEAFTVIETTDA